MSNFQVVGATFTTMTEVRASAVISPTMCVKTRFDLHVSEVDDLSFMRVLLGAVNTLSLPDYVSELRTPNDCLVFFAKQLEPSIKRMALLPVSRSITLEVCLNENMSLTRTIQIRTDGLPQSSVCDTVSAEELTQKWYRHSDARPLTV
jgi:hypothetical protein